MRRVHLLVAACMLLVAACESAPPTDGTVTTTPLPGSWQLPTIHDGSGSGWMVAPDGVWVSEPMVRDPVWYSEVAGISLEEAGRRNGFVEEVVTGKFSRRLERVDGLGGVWTEETPESWHLVVAADREVGETQGQIDRLLKSAGVRDSVVVREVDYSLQTLQRKRTWLHRLISRWCLPPMTDSMIDMVGNRLVVGTQDPIEFVANAEKVGADLAGVVVVEDRVDPAPERGTGCGMIDLVEFEAARALWEAQGIDRYRFVVVRSSAWGLGGRFLVSVEGDTFTFEVLESGLLDGWDQGGFEGMFDWAEANWEPGVLAIRTHPDWGFIVSVSYDQPTWIDEEWRYRVTAFSVNDEPLSWFDEDDRP